MDLRALLEVKTYVGDKAGMAMMLWEGKAKLYKM
jgi:hypothetical protein